MKPSVISNLSCFAAWISCLLVLLLRAEIEAGEVALEKVSGALGEARAKLQDAELKLKTSQDALVEKEAMINYVQEEVDRVKGVGK